jgi:hypothetical protein
MKRILAFRSHFQKMKDLYTRYERVLLPATLVVGFLVDYVTFTNIEIRTTLALLFGYWIAVTVTIAFMYIYDAGRLPEKLRYARLFAPLLVQFTFGALLGGSFIFYWFSGSFWVSWPLIAAFILLMVANDAFKHYFMRPAIQISVYFFITMSLFAVALPFILHSLSPWLFVIASGLALVEIFIFVTLLSEVREIVKQQRKIITACIIGIVVLMNVFYFSGIIPPIPLVVRESKAYHAVQRSGNNYLLKGEQETFWEKVLPGQKIHIVQGARVYAYTAIFSPKDLNAKIFHEWHHYNGEKNEWETVNNLSFTVTGGRKEGFRGYSFKTNPTPGKWRVYVKTERGQTLGRIVFTINHVETPVSLTQLVR